MPAGLCRDCGAALPVPAPARCRSCLSPRVVAHPELETLAIAHIDCDAFYAAIEKRDDPALRDKAVIVGGSRRGVVLTACYNARIHGVRSAMPMFTALRLCPHATIVRPNMAKYAATGRTIRAMMGALTPLVQPISIDEAFLDLSGTQALHGATPAVTLARFAAAPPAAAPPPAPCCGRGRSARSGAWGPSRRRASPRWASPRSATYRTARRPNSPAASVQRARPFGASRAGSTAARSGPRARRRASPPSAPGRAP